MAPLLAFDADKPNIIVLFSDELGYGDLACYGSKKMKSPNNDRLAEEGMRFTDFHFCRGERSTIRREPKSKRMIIWVLSRISGIHAV